MKILGIVSFAVLCSWLGYITASVPPYFLPPLGAAALFGWVLGSFVPTRNSWLLPVSYLPFTASAIVTTSLLAGDKATPKNLEIWALLLTTCFLGSYFFRSIRPRPEPA